MACGVSTHVSCGSSSIREDPNHMVAKPTLPDYFKSFSPACSIQTVFNGRQQLPDGGNDSSLKENTQTIQTIRKNDFGVFNMLKIKYF